MCLVCLHAHIHTYPSLSMSVIIFLISSFFGSNPSALMATFSSFASIFSEPSYSARYTERREQQRMTGIYRGKLESRDERYCTDRIIWSKYTTLHAMLRDVNNKLAEHWLWLVVSNAIMTAPEQTEKNMA